MGAVTGPLPHNGHRRWNRGAHTTQCHGDCPFPVFLPTQLLPQNDKVAGNQWAAGRDSSAWLLPLQGPFWGAARTGRSEESVTRIRGCNSVLCYQTHLIYGSLVSVILLTFAEPNPILGLSQDLNWEHPRWRAKESS